MQQDTTFFPYRDTCFFVVLFNFYCIATQIRVTFCPLHRPLPIYRFTTRLPIVSSQSVFRRYSLGSSDGYRSSVVCALPMMARVGRLDVFFSMNTRTSIFLFDVQLWDHICCLDFGCVCDRCGLPVVSPDVCLALLSSRPDCC